MTMIKRIVRKVRPAPQPAAQIVEHPNFWMYV